jgi:hypothetical protein
MYSYFTLSSSNPSARPEAILKPEVIAVSRCPQSGVTRVAAGRIDVGRQRLLAKSDASQEVLLRFQPHLYIPAPVSAYVEQEIASTIRDVTQQKVID